MTDQSYAGLEVASTGGAPMVGDCSLGICSPGLAECAFPPFCLHTCFLCFDSAFVDVTALQKISKIKCVETCNKERQKGRCTLAGYDKRTETCYLSDDDPQNVFDTDDEMTGSSPMKR